MNEAKNLPSGERIVAKLRKHWVSLTRDTIGTIILGFLPYILSAAASAYFDLSPYAELIPEAWWGLASALWLLVVWLTLATLWTNYYLDFWIVTNHRIINIEQIGLFNRRAAVWNIDRVQDITTRTANALQTLLGYGTIEVYTAGSLGEGAKMEGIPHPEHVRALILKQSEHVGELEKANEKQDELLHFVSHEVKAHLAKNKAAFASILEGDYGAVPQKLAKMADAALAETDKGVKTVMTILDGSNTKTGELSFEKKPFDLKASVRETVQRFSDSAKEKGLLLEASAGEGSYMMTGDKTKLEEHVIRNLLDNAVRYTPKGKIQVELSRSPERIRLSVADTGVGIVPEDMPKLFTESGKGRDSTMINKDSTGYGLFIARTVVEAHGGSIRAESAGKDNGSRFIVELPAA